MSAAPGPPAPRRSVVFRAGGERFALALEALRQVVLPQPPFARVPRSGPAVKGAMNLRGRIVPVVDLAILLGLVPDVSGERDGQVLVLDAPRGPIGLLVGAVLGVESVEPDGAVTLLDGAAIAAGAASHFGAR